MNFASGVAPSHQDPINRGTHWQCPPKSNNAKLQSPCAPTGWIRSGRRGACDRGGVRNGSFPPLITGSGAAPLHTSQCMSWSLPRTSRDISLIGQWTGGDDIGLPRICTDSHLFDSCKKREKGVEGKKSCLGKVNGQALSIDMQTDFNSVWSMELVLEYGVPYFN